MEASLVWSVLETVAKIDAEKFFQFVKSSLGDEQERSLTVQLNLLGAPNAEKVFKYLIESSSKRECLAKLLNWAAQDNALGEFACEMLSSSVSLKDPEFCEELKSLYLSHNLLLIARVLRNFAISETVRSGRKNINES